MAFARWAPSANVVVTIESAAGDTNAAPRPWIPRATINAVSLCASPQTSEATVKRTTPARKIRLRPIRSPARPPSSRKPPKRSAYELTIHWRFASDMSRSLWIDGSATFTIVASRMTMNCARQTRTRTIHGLTWLEWPGRSVMEADANDRDQAPGFGYPHSFSAVVRHVPHDHTSTGTAALG
jgi:hypothetical protein